MVKTTTVVVAWLLVMVIVSNVVCPRAEARGLNLWPHLLSANPVYKPKHWGGESPRYVVS